MSGHLNSSFSNPNESLVFKTPVARKQIYNPPENNVFKQPLPPVTHHSFSEGSNSFYTPQANYGRPVPTAFLSTGIISKRNRPKTQNKIKPTPETPAKKLNFHTQNWIPPTSPLESFTLKLIHSNNTNNIQLKEKRNNSSPLDKTPIKQGKKIMYQNSTPTKEPNHPNLYDRDFNLVSEEEENDDDDEDENSPQKESRIYIQPRSLFINTTPAKSSYCSPRKFYSTSPCQIKSPLKKPNHALPNFFTLSPQINETGIHHHSSDPYSFNPIENRIPLSKLKNISLLSTKNIFTPFPLFLTREYITSLRKSTEMQQEATSTFDYFDQHFHIVNRLGQGQFSEAFKVISKIDGCYYAIKKTKHSYLGHRDRIEKLEEIEIMWLLCDTLYCVKLVNAWEQNGFIHLQMELCDGGDLEKVLEQDTNIKESQTIHILHSIAKALDEIHQRNIVHLDLKPGNLFIQNEKIKIGDFGIATFFPISYEREREGDRTYIAPEILGVSTIDQSADIFSLGLITLEMAANIILPPNGIDWSLLRTGNLSLLNFEQKPSDELILIISNMLNINPKERPNAKQIIEYCESFISNQSNDIDIKRSDVDVESHDVEMS